MKTCKTIIVGLTVLACCILLAGMAFATDPVMDGLSGWYKIDTITGKNAGDGVERWNDSAPGVTHYLRAPYDDPAQGPTYKTNVFGAMPALRYFGDTRGLIGNSWGGGDPEFASAEYTYCCVVSGWTGGTVITLANGYAAGYWGDKPALYLRDGKPTMRHHSSPANESFLGYQTAASPARNVITAVFGAGAGDMALYVDGVASTQAIETVGAPTDFSAVPRTLLLSQDYYGSFSYFNGYLGEVLIYNRKLTDVERIQNETYLMAKYPATPKYNLTINAGLLDYTGNLGLVPVRLQLSGPNSYSSLQDVWLVTNPQNVVYNMMDPGTYTLTVSAGQFVQQILTINLDSDKTVPVSLANGDVDGDNSVTSTDLSIVLKSIDAVGDGTK